MDKMHLYLNIDLFYLFYIKNDFHNIQQKSLLSLFKSSSQSKTLSLIIISNKWFCQEEMGELTITVYYIW